VCQDNSVDIEKWPKVTAAACDNNYRCISDEYLVIGGMSKLFFYIFICCCNKTPIL